MIKICLDAGHYGKYNRSPANGKYYESDMVWKLHLYQKQYLEAYGIQVITTRSNQNTDRGLYDRGAASKGCDLFISDHSNAVGSGINNSIDYPVAYGLNEDKDTKIDDISREIGGLLASCVESIMKTKQKARVSTRWSGTDSDGDGQHDEEYYGVLRGAKAVNTPGIILEHSFHTNANATNWLLDDENLKKLAKAEADVIAKYFGVKEKATTPDLPYIVRVEIADLNIREKPTMDSPSRGYTGKGSFTIVAESDGKGASKWGKLKSGAGWISLDFAKRI